MKRKKSIWITLIVLLVGVIATIVTNEGHLSTVRGVVIQKDVDPRKQSPIADVEISVLNGLAVGDSKSDSAGFFRVLLLPGTKPWETIYLRFQHPDYQPLDLIEPAGNKLYVVRLAPLRSAVPSDPNHPEIVVANILVRYTRDITTISNIGSAVKTFEIVNTGNVLCPPHSICSPDGRWKAARGAASLDAGEGNEFRNARVSCIAGPCPFTKIDSDGFSKGGQVINASVIDWSDTATYLIQAEVYHTEVTDTIQESHPVILGRALDFTLPPSAQGPSIEAELNGAAIVFPFGNNTSLSWADCEIRTAKDATKTYRCGLKPGYRFQ